MFYVNSHHLFDALQLDRDGCKIEHTDCIVGFVKFSEDVNRYEKNVSEIREMILSIPNKTGSTESEFRNYLFFSHLRTISLAHNIMTDPSLYVNAKYHQCVVKDFLCARSLMETVSVFYASYDTFKDSVGNPDDFMNWKRGFVYSTNLTGGNNRKVTLPGLSGLTSPKRIMSMINMLSKKHPFVNEYYHLFSEFCHPNGMGLYFVGNVDSRVEYGYNIGYALSLVLSLLDEYGATMKSFLDAMPIVAAI